MFEPYHGAYLGHVFIWRSLVQGLLDIFIHLPVVIWTFLTRDPLRVQPGARDRWTAKDGEGLRQRSWKVNQEDSSKSDDWKVCMNPKNSTSVKYGRVGNTRWWSRKVQTSLWVLKSGKSTLWVDDGYQCSTNRPTSLSNKLYLPRGLRVWSPWQIRDRCLLSKPEGYHVSSAQASIEAIRVISPAEIPVDSTFFPQQI